MQEYIFNPSLSGRTLKLIYSLLMLLIILLLTTCKKEESTTKEYPRINTLDVSGINESGATFGASIISGDLSQTTEYGFVWDTSSSPEIELNDKIIVTGDLNSKTFNGIVHTALKKDVIYYVRAYVKTGKYLVYGKVVSFKSLGSDAPVITDFSPKSASWSDTVKITGKNFSLRMNHIVVKLGDVQATIIANTDTTIKIVVPAKRNSEKVTLSVSVEGNASNSTSQFSYLIPQISGINPLTATFNDTIYIKGINFFKDTTGNKVYFNGSTASIVYKSRTLLKVLVPATLTVNQAKIKVSGPVADIEFGSIFSLKAVILKSFEPDTVFLSDQIITIKGENFNPLSLNNKVIIKGLNASIIESSLGQLKVKLPTAILPEKYFSLITNSDIAITTGQQEAKFSKNLEICLRSRWTKKNDFPGVPRYCGAGFSIGNKGYFGLGYRYPENYYLDFWEYDPQKDIWTQKTDFPGKGRYGASALALNGEGYVGLGITLMATDQIYLKDFYKYSPDIEAWTKIADLPGSPRYSAASFVKDGKAFVGTGRISREDYSLSYDDGIIANDFWSYNPQIEQWNEVQSFPYRTGNAVAFTIGNEGYVYENEKITQFTDNNWLNKCSTTSYPHGFEASFAIGSSGYIVFGGINDIYEFDSNINQIKKIPMPVQVAGLLPAIFVINKKAYLVCGEQNTINTKTVWEFDPSLPVN